MRRFGPPLCTIWHHGPQQSTPRTICALPSRDATVPLAACLAGAPAAVQPPRWCGQLDLTRAAAPLTCSPCRQKRRFHVLGVLLVRLLAQSARADSRVDRRAPFLRMCRGQGLSWKNSINQVCQIAPIKQRVSSWRLRALFTCAAWAVSMLPGRGGPRSCLGCSHCPALAPARIPGACPLCSLRPQ
jgi:hypothetical protein